MCGIAGFIDFSKSSSEKILTDMTDTLVHRGPDGAGSQLFEKDHFQLGLGHRRLSIIDLSEHAAQPMRFEELHLVFNGEIYNFKEIRTQLEHLGHAFKTQSDTEVILHAYKQWDVKCVDHFIGMFAIVIFDESTNEIFCIRDRAGVKPFFYASQDGLFLFASELKAFARHPHFTKKLNHDAVASFVQYGNIPAPHCIYQDCFKLKPGYYFKLKIEQNAFNSKIETQKYWSVYTAYNQPKKNLAWEDGMQQTEQILQSAVDYRMVADVPVGVFLSGGYDSSCVTALLQKSQNKQIKTFTIAVPDIGLNEAPYAKDIAQHLETDHHEYNCTQKEALDLIPTLPHFYDEPFADSSAIPTMLLSQHVKKEVTVALSADAGDELFAGYNRYDYLLKYGTKLNQIPGFLRKSAAAMMDQVSASAIPVLKNKYNFPNRYEKLKGLLRDPSPEKMMLSLSKQFTDEGLNQLFKHPFKELKDAYSSKEMLPEFYSPLSYMMAIDYTTYLPDDIMQKVDRATMSASLEGREPFLDHRIIEFVASLPDDWKYHKREKKYLLKEIVHQYVPKTMLDRPKMGFAIPIEKWMQNELRDLAESYLSDERITNQDIFNLSYIQQLKSQFFSGKNELGFKMWYLICFQMWFETHMER